MASDDQGDTLLRRYVPLVYGLTVVVLSVTGTLYTDILTDDLGVPLALSTSVFAVVVFLHRHEARGGHAAPSRPSWESSSGQNTPHLGLRCAPMIAVEQTSAAPNIGFSASTQQLTPSL